MGRNPKITNDEILEAAREVFLDQGSGASTADIADRAGISEASIFKRFATKQDLFMAAIGITKTPTWVKKLESGTPNPEFKAELIEICGEILAFYQDVFPRVIMMMSPMKLLLMSKQFIPPPIRDSHLLAGFLQRAIDLGYLRPCDARTVAQALVGAVNNYAMTQTFINSPRSSTFVQSEQLKPEEFVRSTIDILWAGIAPEP
jgi:AcrR family transcriptional regulator